MTSILIVIPYLITKNWILNNLIGISVVITIIKSLKIPSYKIGALLLGCTFLFDIFWVFYSDRIFGQSVMVTIFNKNIKNRFIFKVYVATKINLPMKLVFPIF